MGLFDAIGNTFDFLAKPIVGFATGGPMGAIQGLAGNKRSDKILERNENQMAYNDPFSGGYGGFSSQTAMNSSPSSQSFFGNLGQTIGNFGRDVGGFFQDINPALNLFGINNPMQRTNSGTASTIIRQAPDETSTSGEILGANLGMAAPLVQAGRQFLRSPGGQSALGFGAGAFGSALMGGGDGKVRITRRMKSDVRKIYMMAGMDPNATAQILNNLGTYPRMNFDANLVFFILTKRFRNDGPVVTKAAVRKTKTTLRRMKGVVDMYNSVCKPTTTRRRAAPSRAKAVQLISNK